MHAVSYVHHGVAVGPEEDPRRPLSTVGLADVARVAAKAAALGAKPDVVWHSGKLRAKQTAQEFWRACNALAEFSASRICSPTIRRSGSAIACAAKRATSRSPVTFRTCRGCWRC